MIIPAKSLNLLNMGLYSLCRHAGRVANKIVLRGETAKVAHHGWLQANLLPHCHCRQSLGRGELTCYINAKPFYAAEISEIKSPRKEKERVTDALGGVCEWAPPSPLDLRPRDSRAAPVRLLAKSPSPARRFHERSATLSLSRNWSEFPGFFAAFLGVFFCRCWGLGRRRDWRAVVTASVQRSAAGSGAGFGGRLRGSRVVGSGWGRVI
jgi:hypothetical protein